MRPLEPPSLQAATNAGILAACERYAIDVDGRTEFLFDPENARYSKKKLSATTLETNARHYWTAWQFFAEAGYYESMLPLVRGPALAKPFPAMEVGALVVLVRYKCLPAGEDLRAPSSFLFSADNDLDDSDGHSGNVTGTGPAPPLRHVVTGDVLRCTSEWTAEDVETFTCAISRLHRALGHSKERSSQEVCEDCLARYRAAAASVKQAGRDGSRVRRQRHPCPRHRKETVHPPMFRWGDPTRLERFRAEMLRIIGGIGGGGGGGAVAPTKPSLWAARTAAHDRDETRNFNVDWIFGELSRLPIAANNPALLERCRPIVRAWDDEFCRTQPPVWWSRMRRNLPKELNESSFVLDDLLSFVEDYREDQPLRIVDLCSGVGFLSMFLSHLLPPSKVSHIMAVDIMFRTEDHLTSTRGDGIHGQDGNNPESDAEDHGVKGGDARKTHFHHLRTDHLMSPIHPIPILPRRANIKKESELRNIAQSCKGQGGDGPVVVLGIHLCKSLSVHAVKLFHLAAASVTRLCLKPCCLPGRKELVRRPRPPFWTFQDMEGGGFGVETLYCSEARRDEENPATLPSNSVGSYVSTRAVATKAEAMQMNGDSTEESGRVPRSGERLFSKWVELLRDAAGAAPGATAEIHCLPVMVRGYENQFIVGTR